MIAEHESLMKNQTWDLTSLPLGKKPIRCKWVYKVKYKAYGTLDKYKARLVTKGFSQREGIDYEETPFVLFYSHGSIEWLEGSSNGCEECLPQQRFGGRGIHVSIASFSSFREGAFGLHTKEGSIWIEIGT